MTAINQHHMQTPVKLPVIYELETPGPVVVHCVVCRSRAFRQDDTLACIACGREIAEVRERRPPTLRALGDLEQPKFGRPRGGAKPDPCIKACGRMATSRNTYGLCVPCNERRRNKLFSEREKARKAVAS